MHRCKTRALAASAALLLVLGACGDDDDSGGSDDATATTEAEGNGDEEAGGGEFCSAYTELLAGDPSPEQIREVAEVAPEAAGAPLEELAVGFEGDPEGFFDTEEFATAFAEVGGIANDECADEVIDVTATEYAFDGIPSELSTGVLGVEFTNDGEEFHELAVVRKNDGVTQTFEELLELSEEEAGEFITEVGGTVAPPGRNSPALLELTEPGEYLAACFIPVGATPDTEEADGPPHFTQGMTVEFTVG